MKERKVPNWNEYFMIQAITASLRSKDPATQVGCVFVDDDNHQITMGYNGMIAGLDENSFTWCKDKNKQLHETKYAYVSHAEENAIMHSKGELKGTTLYVTLFPCNACARMLATKKIKKVYYLEEKSGERSMYIASKKILDAANISYEKISISEETLNLYISIFQKLNK